MNTDEHGKSEKLLIKRDTATIDVKLKSWVFLCSSVFICVPLAFLSTTSTAASISLRDDLDRAVELKQPAQRIVTLAPFLTELVFTVGAGERVVGVSAYSDYPPEAKKLPQVSTAAGFNIEQIAALRPDLVLVWQDSFRPEDIDRIARFGAAVFVAHARNLADVPRLLRAIGTLAGLDASPSMRDFDARVAALRREYAQRPRVSAFLEIWNRPLTTIAGRHFMNEALEICGATNAFKDLDGVAPVVSWEQVYARDPEVIVGASSAASAEEFRANWKIRGTLAAVKANRLVFVDADRIQRLTARTPDGIAALCAGIDRVRPASPAR
jgi:iron complex transport system substrate-binding protein